jgi:hypothetical protein
VTIDSLQTVEVSAPLLRDARPTRVPSGDAAVRRELNLYLDSIGRCLPAWFCRSIIWLRRPSRVLVRVAVALLLMVGGVLSFLPVLGLWMLPLGLVLLSQDLPFLQRPLLRVFRWVDRTWKRWRPAA